MTQAMHVLVMGHEYDYGVDDVRVFSSKEKLREWVSAHSRLDKRCSYELWIVPVDEGISARIGEVD